MCSPPGKKSVATPLLPGPRTGACLIMHEPRQNIIKKSLKEKILIKAQNAQYFSIEGGRQ